MSEIFVTYFRHHSPVKEVAGLDAGTATSEVSTGKTLVRPQAPATVVRAHAVAQHLLLSCTQRDREKQIKHKPTMQFKNKKIFVEGVSGIIPA